ncbi:MAG: hypothetical protein WCE49_08215 [Terrimicrobiaceae bacterium]
MSNYSRKKQPDWLCMIIPPRGIFEISGTIIRSDLRSSRSGHVAWRGVLEQDFAFADFYLPRRTTGKEDDARRHLLGKTQNVGGVSAGRLEANGVAHDQRAGNGIGGWCNRAKHGILDWIIVKPAGELTDGASRLETLEGRGSGIACTKVGQLSRGKTHPGP